MNRAVSTRLQGSSVPYASQGVCCRLQVRSYRRAYACARRLRLGTFTRAHRCLRANLKISMRTSGGAASRSSDRSAVEDATASASESTSALDDFIVAAMTMAGSADASSICKCGVVEAAGSKGKTRREVGPASRQIWEGKSKRLGKCIRKVRRAYKRQCEASTRTTSSSELLTCNRQRLTGLKHLQASDALRLLSVQ